MSASDESDARSGRDMSADEARREASALVWLIGAAAEVAGRWGWSEQQFIALVKWCWKREVPR